MKIGFILFVFLAYAMAKVLILNESQGQPAIDFPTLDIPSFDFVDLSGGCGGFVDCIEYVGAVLLNMTLGIIFIVLLLINLIVYVFEVIGKILSLTFEGIEGAPFWVNALVVTPFLAALGVVIFKLIRSGESNSD